MKEILINIFVEHLPQIVAFLFAIISAIITKKILPLIKVRFTSEQLAYIKEWTEFLVESAQRLDKSGKLEEMTKKEYVMKKLLGIIETSGFSFTENQLNDIRRAAVLALENAEKIADNIVGEIIVDDTDVAGVAI